MLKSVIEGKSYWNQYEKCREVKRGVEKCEQCPGGREVGEPLASVMEVATNILPKMFECLSV